MELRIFRTEVGKDKMLEQGEIFRNIFVSNAEENRISDSLNVVDSIYLFL